MSIPPFLSHESSIGPSSGEDFYNPKLRQFPEPARLCWMKFLGAGEDGFVIQAKADTSLFAVKFFYHSKPPPTRPFPCHSLPRPGRYWALERECRTASLLAIIQTTSRRRVESGRPVVHINPEPKTDSDAIANLKIFSSESFGNENTHSDRREPFTLNVHINQCFGWLELPRQAVLHLLNLQRPKDYVLVPQLQRAYGLDDSERCFAVVYEYVPEGDLDPEIVQRHLDFFYLAGFALMPFREENWRGNVLVDHSDLIPPQSLLWWKPHYGRMEIGWYVEELRKWSA
ncbi:hypothetical protein B0H67DRAFT_558328 [Lasiosphaeris hirsuta]|uniref:Uncharacterized protein n=1 Tax=Lasiosphaeris hirsuta TaxID=260670 RepID=A0AA39ZSC1_9PEZI|nr:hypothetical protein B0H67DRAFT_558328 [Lasiosphaeris hirsuta]